MSLSSGEQRPAGAPRAGEQRGELAQGKMRKKKNFPPKPQSRKKEALSQQEPAVKQVQEVWRGLFPGGIARQNKAINPERFKKRDIGRGG